ncbi:putative sinapine esterase [Helianthus annuus]|uniref:Sinapine esterase n=1 Tax=Helianthus annuus TaxID=4232 RepID=A0A9K3DKF7_HELAN|nr:putative sinapine esterase [Helianthus annuus]KAJ0637719.1 putative sinapine esterase [Helianthus annuus]
MGRVQVYNSNIQCANPKLSTHLPNTLVICIINSCLLHVLGFTNGALKACCGGEGRYNVDPSVECGDASATVCDEPDTYVSWDGIHLTEAAYKIISKNLFSTPQFNSLCSTLTSGVGSLGSI